jgi:O-antigen ligase
MAILLTFGRNGMLPFEGIYTLLDRSMNLFVVIVAPLFAIKSIYPRPINNNLHLFLPIILLSCWVIICVFIGSPNEYWPDRTSLITIVLSILLASQITRFELSRLRHFVLLLAGVFSIYTLIYGQSSLDQIFGGALDTRLGIDVSSSNVIIFPRIMYMFIITCAISLVIEKNIWIRVCSGVIMILPFLIALATGTRGSLVGFVAAVLVFIFCLRNKFKTLYAVLVVAVLAIIGHMSISRLLPIMQQRISFNEEGIGRIDIWNKLINTSNITWFGNGVSASYPHNIFLELLYVYGIIGFVLFLVVIVTSFITAYRFYRNTRDLDSLWVISILVLQMTAQQLSLDIFYGSFWASIALPLGFGWNCSPDSNKSNIRLYGDLGVKASCCIR